MILIIFDDWRIDAACCQEQHQLDHLSQRLIASGLPADRRWEALVQYGDNVNIISLEAEGDKFAATLTRDDLPFDGTYTVQLRGTQGETVRHTNVADFYVNYTISGDRKWPTIPTEFTQLENRIYKALDGVGVISTEIANDVLKVTQHGAASANVISGTVAGDTLVVGIM